MVVLAHFKKDNFELKLAAAIALKNEYVAKKFGAEKRLFEIIDDVESFFKQIGDTTNESKVSGLKTYLSTTTSGINPETLQVIKSDKRKILRASVFHCLSVLSSILEHELEEIDNLISRCNETISQVILSALQSKIISYDDLYSIDSISDVERYWNSLVCQYDQIKFINTKLKTEILSQDIWIILDLIIKKIDNAHERQRKYKSINYKIERI